MPDPLTNISGDGSKSESAPATVKARGLEGVVALDSQISFIDGQHGDLIYRGYDIYDLAENASFEEVAFLLWNGSLPNDRELSDLKSRICADRDLPESVLEMIRLMPAEANPMAALRTAVSALALEDGEADEMSREANYRKSVRLLARVPTAIAAFDRSRKGLETVAPKKDCTIAHDFLYMLNGEAPGQAAERTFDACLVLHAEHGLNASTFTGRVIGSTLADLYSAITGAIGALKGPLHGGANQEVMRMLLEIDESGIDPAEYVRSKLDRKERVMGFGHRVYKTMDPRAAILREMVEELSEETNSRKWYEYSTTIMDTVQSAKGLYPNVDFFSASVYYMLGIDIDLYTPIFALSRTSGWTAHLLEQWDDNRLIRPRAEYVGPRGYKVKPIAERS